MSVRHIHAKPGEYIAVHRNGGYRSSRGGGSADGIGCLFLVALFLLLSYWKEIIIIALSLGIVALFGWLVWTFRRQIGKGLYIGGKATWHGIRYIMSYIWKKSTMAYHAIKNRWTQRGKTAQPIGSSSVSQRPAGYGKIIQKF